METARENVSKDLDFIVDSEDFYFNKSDLVVEIEPRHRQPLRVDDEMRLPAYVHTYVEELSRDLCTYYKAPKLPSELPVAKYKREERDLCFPVNEEAIRVTMDQLKAQQPSVSCLPRKDLPLLQHYHPEYRNPTSTFKRVPPVQLRKVLQQEPFNSNFLFSVGPIVQPEDGRNVPPLKSRIKFEPVFGTVTIYAVAPSRRSFDTEEMIRVTESFHFDATDQSFKDKYPEVYHGGRPDTGLPVPPATPDPALDLSACLFSIPMEFRKSDLFLVVQLSKVLTSDGDKAVAPYLRSSGIPEATKHEDACRRLYNFRQPLALSIWKLFDDSGKAIISPKSGRADLLNVPFYCMRSCINDHTLKQYIREFYPKDGNAKPRLDVIDIEMNLAFYDLGNADEVVDHLPPQLKQNYEGVDSRSSPVSPTSRAHRRDPSFVSESSPMSRGADGRPETPVEVLSNPTSPLYVVPAQFHEPQSGSEDEVLAQVVNRVKSRGGTLPSSICFPDVVPVRKLMSLEPVREFEDDFEPIQSAVDHSLFLYPTGFEKFHHRNLCLRVMLIELSSAAASTDTTALHHLPYTVLKNIYNTMPGSMFTDFAHTQVTYHSRNPSLNDEIKIRLPLALTSKHYLLFEMHHVHVKPKKETRRSSISSMLGFKDTGEDTLSVKIGQAYHPVLVQDKGTRTYYLPPNGEYSVQIFESTEADEDASRDSASHRKRGSATYEPGIIKFTIASKSSFISTAPEVQQFFMSQERTFNSYGGVLPSSLSPYDENKHHVPKAKKKGNPSGAGLSDLKFVTSVTSLLTAPRRELKLHFQMLMRQLTNTLCSGGMVFAPNFYMEDYASPLHHPAGRCWAFIAMLHLFHRIEPEGSNYATGDVAGRKSSIISTYVEFLFDEEVCWNDAKSAGSSVAHYSTDDTKNMINVVNELRLREKQTPESPAKKAEDKYSNTVGEHCTSQVENVELSILLDEAVDSVCLELLAIVEADISVTAKTVCSPTISVNDEAIGNPPEKLPKKKRCTHCSDHCAATMNLADVLEGKNYTSLGCDPCWEARYRFEEEAISDSLLTDNWYLVGVIRALRPRGLTEPNYFTKYVRYDTRPQMRKRTPSFLLRSDSVTGYLISSEDDHEGEQSALAQDLLAESGSETSEAIAERFNMIDTNGSEDKRLSKERKNSFQSMVSEAIDLDISIAEETQQSGKLVIQPILPMPTILEGADERRVLRKERSKRVSLDIKSLGMPVHHSSYPQQWWPYMYEVITQQWFCLLTALTQSATSAAHDPILEEGSEEDASDDGDSGDGGYDQGQYAFTRENMPMLGTVPPGSSPDEMIRWIALDQGPVLLQMIMKSIAIRVSRSKLRLPVMFDDAYLHLLEKLVVLITKETMSLKKGINRHSKLNSALASFLKELFGVVALVQVAQLIQAYFRTVRGDLGHGAANVNIPDLRLKFLGTIASFDDFVGINIPLVLESISEFDSHELFRSRTRSVYSLLDSGSAHRWVQHPRSYWLSHLLIEEVMYIYRYEINNAFAEAHGRQDVQGFRKRSLRFICDLLVRICYDPRYQSFASRRRIAIMFCPMLREITSVVDRLAGLPHDSTERKEFLVIFLYLLQNYPQNLLRTEWRHFLSIKDLSKKMDSIRRNSETGLPVPQLANLASASFNSSKNSMYALPILKIFELMHLCLDTFEFPMKKGNAEGNPSNVLAPVLASDVDTALGGNNSYVPKKGSEGTVDKISRLENIRQSRVKGRPADLRRKSSSHTSLPGQEQDAPARSWKQHMTNVKSMVTVTGTASGVRMENVAPATLMTAAKCISNDVSVILFECLEQIFQEFDVHQSSGEFQVDSGNWEECHCFSEALKHAMAVCLHGLLSSQSVESYSKIFEVARFIFSKFGSRAMVAAIGDTLQDWMHIIFRYCNSIHVDLRVAACSFFLHFLISVSREFGSLNVILHQINAMYCDAVLSEVTRGNSMTHLVSNHEKRSGAVNAASTTGGLKLSMTYIADVIDDMCKDNDCVALTEVSGLHRVKSILSSLLTILEAYCLLNNYFPDFSSATQDSFGNSRGDMEYTIDVCFKASEVFDPVVLPTYRIRWLMYIARLHVLQRNMAEHAECLTRICTVYEQTAAHWKDQWFPRQLIEWTYCDGAKSNGSTKEPKNFLDTLQKALSRPPVKAWESGSAFRDGMISALELAMDNYFKSRFFFLAEKTALRLLAVHRADGEFNAMKMVYEKQASILSQSLNFSTGNYFRVLFVGAELPSYLSDQEFIYRNADLLHVSEFQNMLKNHLRDILPGINVSVIPDSYFLPDAAKVGISQSPTVDDSSGSSGVSSAMIVMAAVKPFSHSMNVEAGGDWSSQQRKASQSARNGFDFDAISRVGQFQYSVPFTKTDNKTYAKTIDKQWKRTTYLTVKESFPFINIRATVVRRDIRELSPIENSISDLDDCIQQMREQLRGPMLSKESLDISNLKRFIQGTVVAQVNGGAAAVAKTFLGTQAGVALEGFEGDNNQSDLMRRKLQKTLLEFLTASRMILERTEEIFIEMRSLSNIYSPAVEDSSKIEMPSGSLTHISSTNLTKLTVASRSSITSGTHLAQGSDTSVTRAPDSEAMSTLWMFEMQKEFNNLVDIVVPLLVGFAAEKKLKKF